MMLIELTSVWGGSISLNPEHIVSVTVLQGEGAKYTEIETLGKTRMVRNKWSSDGGFSLDLWDSE